MAEHEDEKGTLTFWRVGEVTDEFRRENRLQLVWCGAGSHYFWRRWSLRPAPRRCGHLDRLAAPDA
jgi:hypothetical protein